MQQKLPDTFEFSSDITRRDKNEMYYNILDVNQMRTHLTSIYVDD